MSKAIIIPMYRITKYNPKYRTEDNKYLNDEWTSYYDIGRVYNNKVFLIEEYIETEKKYIDAILAFAKVLQKDFVLIDNQRVFDSDIGNHKQEIIDAYKKIETWPFYKIQTSEINNLIKMNLREIINISIFFDENNIVEFGDDYYMYFYSSMEQDKIEVLREKVESIGLYFEYLRYEKS